MKHIFACLAIFSALSSELPEIIDLSQDDFRNKIEHVEYRSNHLAFNQAIDVEPFVIYLKQQYAIDTVIETGTFKGETTNFFAQIFDEVYTIEIVEELYERAIKRFRDNGNVHCCLGSSEKVLHDILPSLREKRVLFYLDAHWNSFWPLLDELREIARTHRDNCIVVVDDFKVPGRADILYDKYGKYECSFEYIRERLDDIFSSYTGHYVMPSRIACRAKFVAIPN